MKRSKKHIIKKLQFCCLTLATTGFCLCAAAGYPNTAAAGTDNPQIDYGLTAGFSTMSMNNTHFGLGQFGVTYYPKDIARSEGYLAPSATLIWNTLNSGTIYGGVRAVGSMTKGSGDSWGLTVGEHHDYTSGGVMVGENMSYLNIDKLYVGWRSGDVISFLDKDGLDLSVGKQNYQLGDGMVLVDGDNEANQRKGIYWLDPRQGWNNTAIVRVKSLPFQAEFFYLQSDSDGGNPVVGYGSDNIVGGNLELFDKKFGKVGFSYFKDVSSAIPMRDGLSVTGWHGRGNPFSALPNLELAGEIDYEKNMNSNPVRDAMAWFGEAKYSLPDLPWHPTLGYRYSSFSGDKASTTGVDESWDPLYYGSTSRGFGYWYQGIVVGTYETLLSNLNTHFVNLTLMPPVQGSWMKIFYYDYTFNDPSTAQLFTNSAVSSNKFATEWDVILGYSPTPKVDYMAVYGLARPGQGGIDRVFGNNKNANIIQFTLLYHL